MCKINTSVAFDVIEVKLHSLQNSHQCVTLHLTYDDLQRCLPSQVTLSCGMFLCMVVTIIFLVHHHLRHIFVIFIINLPVLSWLMFIIHFYLVLLTLTALHLRLGCHKMKFILSVKIDKTDFFPRVLLVTPISYILCHLLQDAMHMKYTICYSNSAPGHW